MHANRIYILFVQLILVVLSIGATVDAQEPPKSSATDDYLRKYAAWLNQLQDIKFKYVGRVTRSTPKQGIQATWERDGTVRISATRNSVHITTSSTLIGTDAVGRQDLGTRETLLTPNTAMDVSIADSADPVGSEKQFDVRTRSKTSEDDWINEIVRHELASFLGFTPIPHDEKHLSALAHSAVPEALEFEAARDLKLIGFQVKSSDLEIGVLFNGPSSSVPARLMVVQPAVSTKAGDVRKVTVDLVDAGDGQSPPSAIELTISIDVSGGEIQRPKHAGIRLGNPQQTSIEESIWNYSYRLSDIEYSVDEDWFTLENPVPDGSQAIVDGNYELPQTWRDGKARPMSQPVKAAVDAARFHTAEKGNNIVFWVSVNAALIIAIVVVRIAMKRRRSG